MERALYITRDFVIYSICFIAMLVALAIMCGTACCADLPPSDQGLYQTIIVCADGSPLAVAFQSDPQLSHLRERTAFTHYLPTDKLYIERYQAIVGQAFPIIVYADKDGRVIYSANRTTIPHTKDLFEAIKAKHRTFSSAVAINSAQVQAVEDSSEYANDCPDGICPLPNRQPVFPGLKPLRHPFDSPDYNSSPVFDRLFNGAISNSVKSGLFMVFSFVALGIVFVFGMFLLVAMVLLARWMR